jgi:parallel beta-helix repeat protein
MTMISLLLLLVITTALYVVGPAWSLGRSTTVQLLVSGSPDRSGATSLDGRSLSGRLYVFAAPASRIAEVTFLLDGSRHRTEHFAPFDFNGTASGGGANAWHPATGRHTITAKITTKRGAHRTVSAIFSVRARPATTTSTSTTAPTTTVAPTTTAPPGTSPSATCTGVRVAPGTDVQQAINASPTGATICFQAGTYRLAQPLVPKAGQRLIGLPGAILSGSRHVTSFGRSGSSWVAADQLPSTADAVGVCMAGYAGCKYSEAVFYDGRPLWRVTSLSELGAGKFYENYATGKLYIADDPNGHTVEVARAKAAIKSSASGVTVKGLIVEEFANNAQRGAIVGASDWTIEGNEVRLNHGVGVETPAAHNVKVLGNNVHHNGQLGMSGWRTTNALYEGNTLAFNNTAGFYNADWEAGGGKWTESSALTVRNNSVHDNKAVGLWFDINDRDVTIEGNRIQSNDSDGIRYEISYDAVIRDNQIADNGFKDPTGWVDGAGIMISSAKGVEIAGNVVDSNFNGITLRQDDRGAGSLGEFVVEDTRVHDNQVTMRRGTSGLSSTTGDKSIITSRNNTFQRNHYTIIGTDTTNFSWIGSEVTWAEWQRFGQDLNGTFTRR